MGRLTIEIPDSTHHHLKMVAVNRGVTIREYILERIMPDLQASRIGEPSLAELASAWEERRKGFRLERGDRNLREMIHEGHKW